MKQLDGAMGYCHAGYGSDFQILSMASAAKSWHHDTIGDHDST